MYAICNTEESRERSYILNDLAGFLEYNDLGN
jgi:hypothetical protein